MAATAEGRRLTEAHRLAQLRIGTTVVAQMLTAWSLLQASDLDGSVGSWLAVAIPLVSAQRRASAGLAANYLGAFRSLELGVDAEQLRPVLADRAPLAALTTSLTLMGPARARAASARGVPVGKAMENASVSAAGAAMRHALNGGRDTIVETVSVDRRALGWARATSGSACSFCAMLASRGPAYRGERTADFAAHDHCSCSVEPVYRSDSEWPAGAQKYRDLWETSTAGLGGDEARNAFRRALATA